MDEYERFALREDMKRLRAESRNTVDMLCSASFWSDRNMGRIRKNLMKVADLNQEIGRLKARLEMEEVQE